MIRSSSNDSSPPLMDNVGPRTDTPFWGAVGRLSCEASIWNELDVGASFCFLNMIELLAMRAGSARRSHRGRVSIRELPTTLPSTEDHRAFAEPNRDASHSPKNRRLRRGSLKSARTA